jgi:hypothetical protein
MKISYQGAHYTCSICRKECPGFSNNAYPVNNGRCCNYCNANVVIPARLKEMSKGQMTYEASR